MILYALKCVDGHSFDGWFRSGDDYDQQARRHVIECPVCGSADVSKAVMAPAIARTDERSNASPRPPKEVATYFAALRKHVEDNFDYVGEKFPEEARKIHYGETDERAIYGEASPAEAKELIEEGVEVAPLPGAKRRRSPRTRAN